MGQSTKIYFKVINKLEPIKIDFPVKFWKVEDVDYDCDLLEATHVIKGDHWYSIGYERGKWPHICHVLMQLFASRNIEKVWYTSDADYVYGKKSTTIEDVLKLSEYYMKSQHVGIYGTKSKDLVGALEEIYNKKE